MPTRPVSAVNRNRTGKSTILVSRRGPRATSSAGARISSRASSWPRRPRAQLGARSFRLRGPPRLPSANSAPRAVAGLEPDRHPPIVAGAGPGGGRRGHVFRQNSAERIAQVSAIWPPLRPPARTRWSARFNRARTTFPVSYGIAPRISFARAAALAFDLLGCNVQTVVAAPMPRAARMAFPFAAPVRNDAGQQRRPGQSAAGGALAQNASAIPLGVVSKSPSCPAARSPCATPGTRPGRP